MSTNNRYNSVVPQYMTNSELRNICTELQTAKNWGLNTIIVDVPSPLGTGNIIPALVMVDALPAYQKAYRTETGQIARPMVSCNKTHNDGNIQS